MGSCLQGRCIVRNGTHLLIWLEYLKRTGWSWTMAGWVVLRREMAWRRSRDIVKQHQHMPTQWSGRGKGSKKHGFQLWDIFNMDETGLFFSVLRSGSVRFFDPKMGNRQPQPVATITQVGGTATGPSTTGPNWSGCPKRLVRTGFNRIFFLFIKFCIVLNKTN